MVVQFPRTLITLEERKSRYLESLLSSTDDAARELGITLSEDNLEELAWWFDEVITTSLEGGD